MAKELKVEVPDIGEFADVDVVEILVKPGDQVNAEDSLLTLETDKATMEIPSPAAGKVKEILTKVGDKVSKGTVIAVLEAEETANAPASEPKPAETPAQAAKQE
ncbi:MAG TPA: biotin/lipoyl-containing protein, partial [Gammaproteobacteria bacterium]